MSYSTKKVPLKNSNVILVIVWNHFIIMTFKRIKNNGNFSS